MRAEWSKQKALSNLLKHGVNFVDAAVALENVNALTIEDFDFEEHRYKTLALGPNLKILMIVYATPEDDVIRIISARQADRKETQQYFRGIGHE